MVFVVSAKEKPLMPTSPYRARKLLKKGRAKIYRHHPFTIMITDREDGAVQDIEYCTDVGYLHVGISVKSEKHEYLGMQADLLKDEPERHNDRRKYRRTRRNRKRHRAARFDNRKKEEGWLAPSIRHKVEAQLLLLSKVLAVCPVTSIWMEMGQFDTQLLKALLCGEKPPEGAEYQQGERYGIETLREAVFTRDHHTCVFCGRGIKDQAILHVHHVGYWKKDRSDRLSNLATCCEQCHTPANHQPGGALYGKEPKLKSMAPATYMTIVRWQMFHQVKEMHRNVHITYGVKTKRVRRELQLKKTHINDAYCIGEFHPKHRTTHVFIEKKRRNDRILQKFYDAVYIDSRDGKRKTGKELFNGRISRNHKKDSENLHPYRSRKIRKGHISIRRQRTSIKPGSYVRYHGETLEVHGTHTHSRKTKAGKTVTNTNIQFVRPASDGRKSADSKKCQLLTISFNRGWIVKDGKPAFTPA